MCRKNRAASLREVLTPRVRSCLGSELAPRFPSAPLASCSWGIKSTCLCCRCLSEVLSGFILPPVSLFHTCVSQKRLLSSHAPRNSPGAFIYSRAIAEDVILRLASSLCLSSLLFDMIEHLRSCKEHLSLCGCTCSARAVGGGAVSRGRSVNNLPRNQKDL